MKRFLVFFLYVILTLTNISEAKGGFSSSSSSGRGGFSGSSATSKSYVSASTSRSSAVSGTTTRTTTTVSRSYSSRYVSPAGHYGSWGPGYSYTNGLLTGMIIGGMMHPYGTVMYAGPGMYANNSVLYPNGQVVNQQGVLVGTYINGVFTPVENGAIVAQQIPADAGAQSTPIANTGPSVTQILTICVLVLLSVILILVIVGMFI